MELIKVSRLSMLIAMSVVISIIESYIPFFSNIIPGLKLGLANIVVLYILEKYGFREALYVSVVRVFLVSILITGLFNIPFFFSLSGATFSVVAMYLISKLKLFSIVGVSVIGSIFHSIGQVLIGMLLINYNIIYYLPYLLIFSIPTGIIVGIITKKLLDYTKNM